MGLSESPAFLQLHHDDNRKTTSMDRARANHLSRQLQLRLQYARLKVEHGWAKQSLNEVENLYFRHSYLKNTRTPPLLSHTETPPPLPLEQSSLSFKLAPLKPKASIERSPESGGDPQPFQASTEFSTSGSTSPPIISSTNPLPQRAVNPAASTSSIPPITAPSIAPSIKHDTLPGSARLISSSYTPTEPRSQLGYPYNGSISSTTSLQQTPATVTSYVVASSRPMGTSSSISQSLNINPNLHTRPTPSTSSFSLPSTFGSSTPSSSFFSSSSSHPFSTSSSTPYSSSSSTFTKGFVANIPTSTTSTSTSSTTGNGAPASLTYDSFWASSASSRTLAAKLAQKVSGPGPGSLSGLSTTR